MKQIYFTKNWNNKLNCDYFTTIRLNNKYKAGDIIDVYLNGSFMFLAEVIEIKKITLKELQNNSILCYLDTGMSAQKTVEMFINMYQKEKVDLDTVFYCILLKRKDKGLFE